MSRHLRCLIGLVVLTHVVGLAAERPARLRLVEVTTQETPASQSIMITSTEPASYTTHQPDPLTVMVTLRDVDAGDVVSQLNPDARGPVGAVDVVDAVDGDGAAVAEVRITLQEPATYEVRSRRQTIQVRFARSAATDLGREETPPVPPARPATAILSAEMTVEPNVIRVTLRGDGALTPTRIHEAEHLPPRLVMDFSGLALKAEALTVVELDPVDRIRIARNSPDAIRVVLDLARPTVYEIQPDPDDPSVLSVVLSRDLAVDPVARIGEARPMLASARPLSTTPGPAPAVHAETVVDGARDPIRALMERRSRNGSGPAAKVTSAPVASVRPVDVTTLTAVVALVDPAIAHINGGQLARPDHADLPLSTWPTIARLQDPKWALARGAALRVPGPDDLPPDVVPWPTIARLQDPSWVIARGVALPLPTSSDLPPLVVPWPQIQRLAGAVGPFPAEVLALQQPTVGDLPTATAWPPIRSLPATMFVVDTSMAPRRYPSVRDLPEIVVEQASRLEVEPTANAGSEIVALATRSDSQLFSLTGSGRPAPASSALAAAMQPQRQTASAPQRYTGDPINMDFQGADLRAVLRVFASDEVSGLNLVIDPSVQGEVNVDLTEVPWDQAFDIILRANQLAYEIEGTVVRIASIQQLQDEAQDRALLAQREAEAGELIVFTKSLSYAKADDLVQLITNTTLSPRGEVFTDPRTNTLIIRDLADRLATLDDLLDTLDRAEPQVEIEARIVQAGHDSARALGVQWGVTGRASQELGNSLPFQFPNRGAVTGRAGNSEGQGPSGIDSRALPAENAATAVNLGVGAATSALGLTLGSVNGSLNLDVVLSALESRGELAIISSPRVTTQNNVEAEILQGDQIPYQTVANNTVTVQFKEAALTLLVTPQITASNTVIMQVQLENSFADFGRALGDPPIPSIVTQRARTTIQVADGETTVIGGIFENTQSERNNRTPMLHKVPLLGWLFKSTDRSESTDELMIFLTQRIVVP